MDSEILKKFSENFDKAAWSLAKAKLHKHTIQILVRNPNLNQKYEPHGTGVLAQRGDRYFIFTASHVTDGEKKRLYVNTRIGIMMIEGNLDETSLEQNGQIDVAILELEKPLGILLAETYLYFPADRLIGGHIPISGTQYMVIGYPGKNIDVDAEAHTVYTGTSTFLLQMANDKPYKHFGFDKVSCYILRFAGAGTDLETGEKGKGLEDPYGISGCGLWFIKPRIEKGKVILEYYLIGIMFMVKRAKYHVLIGNRIEIIMQKLNW